MENTERKRTCKERIKESLESREGDAKEIFKKIDSSSSKKSEEGYEELDSLALGISKTIQARIELSCGGPSDFLLVNVDSEHQINKIVYHFQDWFDGAEEQVDEDSPLWRLAEYYIEGMF